MRQKLVVLVVQGMTAYSALFGMTHIVPLTDGWRFVKGDDPALTDRPFLRRMSDILDQAYRGERFVAPLTPWTQPWFNDEKWAEVRVPHDWGVDKDYDTTRPYGDGYLDVTGIGWYRRKLKVDEMPTDGKVYFECDGAMSFAFVWLNGRFIGGWPYGYTRWRLDLTPHLKKGENTLSIRCHNYVNSSRWYTGGGLYRDCRLLVCTKDHVVPGSVFIWTPEVTAKRATVRVQYEMSVSGKVDRTFTVENPRLWDIDDPYLYRMDIDGTAYRYGIRTIAFFADARRFQLNGRTVPLNGVSMHHDLGVLGAAWNRPAMRRRLVRLKEAGVNAVRVSHNPPGEGMLELCDELGLLVKDEVFDEWRHTGNCGKRENGYTNLFDIWHERDLRAWIRTDRNHPCVIMYSLGNEICDGFESICPQSEFLSTARKLKTIVESEDATRPTTEANNNAVNATNVHARTFPIYGFNYYSYRFGAFKAANPGVPFFNSESTCMSSTRGEYSFPVDRKFPFLVGRSAPDMYNSSYCWQATGWPGIDGGWACPTDAQWWWMDQAKTCMGEFIWTGFDYLGGPGWVDDWRTHPVFTDPERQRKALEEVRTKGACQAGIHSCNTGFFDLAGFRKDAFYLYQSRWRPDFQMAHILPHWNWQGREGEITPVYVFTSGDEAELFLNGRSLGRRCKNPKVWDEAYRLRWDEVRYEPGELMAVAYRNGKEWARDTVRTTGPVARLSVEPESPSVAADGEDICFVNVAVRDARGDVVPRTRTPLVFSVEGPAQIVATDNGDETDMSLFHSSSRRVFNGWAQALVRPKPGATGSFVVTVRADDLPPASATIAILPATHVPLTKP